MGLLHNNNDDYKATYIPGTPINHWRLVFDDNEESETCNITGGDVGGSTSASKDDGKYGTTRLEMLIQLGGTSDIPIIS